MLQSKIICKQEMKARWQKIKCTGTEHRKLLQQLRTARHNVYLITQYKSHKINTCRAWNALRKSKLFFISLVIINVTNAVAGNYFTNVTSKCNIWTHKLTNMHFIFT